MSESFPGRSFRDPGGSVLSHDGRIFRFVNASGKADLDAFLSSKRAKQFVQAGSIVDSSVLEESRLSSAGLRGVYQEAGAITALEHERILFPAYPYEWAPEMLHAAGKLTIELALALLDDGLGLKDATPYNILFRGPQPVFIDVLSFECRDPGDPTWLPYAQFVRTFLLPLLANKYFGLGLDQILTTRRDGLEPEEVMRWLTPLQKIRPPFLSLVSMPTWLAARRSPDDSTVYQKKSLDNPEKARFILESLLNGLGRSLDRLQPAAKQTSTWSTYMTTNNNYTASHFAAKQKFVEEAMKEFAPQRVLDVGCNTGHFSAIAARCGASVVAADYDPVVLGDVWRNAGSENLVILPVAVNLTRPTPGLGWRNAECASFLDRARGSFDGLLMLAVVHHMLVTERVPLHDILVLAAELTTGIAVIEFIAPDDSMFRRLTRGRDHLHQDLTSQVFEDAVRRWFDIVRVQHLESTSRWLYLLRRKS